MTIEKYAFIKDNIVVNHVIFDDPTEELLNVFKAELDLDDIILATDKTEVGGEFDGTKFWRNKPTSNPSWIKDEELNEWVPPIPCPEESGKYFVWNEGTVSWDGFDIPDYSHIEIEEL